MGERVPAKWRGKPIPKTLDDDGFTARLVKALGTDLKTTAKALGVSPMELIRRGTVIRTMLIEVDRDPFWLTLSDHVDKRVGELLSIREELQRKLNIDRKRRVIQRLRQTNR